jgi:hypothetical protein
MVYDMIHGRIKGMSRLSEESSLTIISSGQFITATNHDGHKMFNINIATSSFLPRSRHSDIVDSPQFEEFLQIMFRGLGPVYNNTITFNVELESPCYLTILPPFTIEQYQQMVYNFATLYGFAAYEFDNNSQIERIAYNSSTPLELAYYKVRRDYLERISDRVHELNTNRVSEVGVPYVIQAYFHRLNTSTEELSFVKPLSNLELVPYRVV